MFGRRKKKTQAAMRSAPASTPTRGVNPNNTIESLRKLKETQGNLEKRVNFLRKKANNQLALAKKNNVSNKQQALLHLKKKKIIDKEANSIEASILTLDEQILRIEGGAALSDVAAALTLANKALKQVNDRVDADKLADMVNDIEDLNADQDEIHEILGAKYDDMNADEDLLAELEELEEAPPISSAVATSATTTKDDELLAELAMLDAPAEVPNVPVPVSSKHKSQEDLELKELQAAFV